MHAVECRGVGGPEVLVLTERPTPSPGEGEVLIAVLAAGVNRPDCLQRRGLYPPPPGASELLGLEVAGTIVAVGPGVSRWHVGDSVCALLEGGGYAAFATAAEGQCLPIPAGLDPVQAATLPEVAFTVWTALIEAGGLQSGDTLLMHGGSSGIGSFAIQVAKAWGARVITTSRGADKAAYCRRLGADVALDSQSGDWVEAVRAATEGKGVDIVLDMLGGDEVLRNLSVLARRGRHVSLAIIKGATVPLDLIDIMRRQLSVTGSMVRPRSRADKARIARLVEEKLWPWLANGTIKPMIFKVFALREVAEAHKVLEMNAHMGKIALDLAAAWGAAGPIPET